MSRIRYPRNERQPKVLSERPAFDEETGDKSVVELTDVVGNASEVLFDQNRLAVNRRMMIFAGAKAANP